MILATAFPVAVEALEDVISRVAVDVAIPALAMLEPAYQVLQVAINTRSAVINTNKAYLAYRVGDRASMCRATLRVATAVAAVVAYVFFFRIADIASIAFSLGCNIHTIACNTLKGSHQSTPQALVDGTCDVVMLAGEVLVGPQFKMAILLILWLGDLWHARDTYARDEKLACTGYLIKSAVRVAVNHKTPINAFKDARVRLAA